MTARSHRPFLPSAHGCAFGNAETYRLPIKVGPLPVAMITGGLCGGMVLDSLRCWRLGVPPAGRTTGDITRVFGAQLRSFQIPSAPVTYWRLQRPAAIRARHRANQRALDDIADHLRHGEPVPVGLVCRLSNNPLALAAHHVVLAYRERQRDARSATFAVYDPNQPGDDGVVLRVAADRIQHSHRRMVHAAFVLRAR